MANNPLEITLRPYRLSDADDLLIYADDEKVTKYCFSKTFTSKEEALAFIKDVCIPHPYCRSICINDRSIGQVSIRPQGGNKCLAEVGYVLAAEYWGQGIMTRALKMAITDGFREFGDVVRMQVLCFVGNKGLRRVLEKLGFQKEGLLRKYWCFRGVIKDVFMYSLLSN